MTMAGGTIRCTFYRMENEPDDAVGGAVITGTMIYDHYPVSMHGDAPSQLLLQQGYETVKTFSAIVVPGTLDLRERDEMEVVAPADHVYFGKRFRIVSAVPSSHNARDPRNKLHLKLTRSVRGHNVQ